MKKTIFIILLLCVFIAPSVLAGQEKQIRRIQTESVGVNSVEIMEVNDAEVEIEDEELIGGDQDEHGCYLMAGYRWCEEKEKCLRSWEEECVGLNKIQANVRAKINNAQQLRQQIQLHKQELQDEMKQLKTKSRKVLQNQNQVREAVHALLASEDLVGGIGRKISEIAQEFNNSVDRTIEAESEIRGKSWLKKIWEGGNKEAGQRIKTQVDLNSDRLKELKELYENFSGSDELKEILKEQIEKIENEMERLDGVANREIKFKGIWGWVKGVFGR
jgi:hypothetical protein